MKKDKEWLKEEVKKLQVKECGIALTVNEIVRGRKIYPDSVMKLIDQLEEPETISQEWIDENKVARIDNLRKMTTSDVVAVEKLKNLIVPKQEEPTHIQVQKYLSEHGIEVVEKPVIPQIVADYIKDCEEQAIHWFEAMDGIASDYYADKEDERTKKAYEWVVRNPDKFVDAFRNDYEVEKEKKYYVLDYEDIPLLERANNQTCKTTTALSIYEDGRDNSRFALTEKEIKDYDPRFWQFAEPVEEEAE